MLSDFVTTCRAAIIARARQTFDAQPWTLASAQARAIGVPRFLAELSNALRADWTDALQAFSTHRSAGPRRGDDLLSLDRRLADVQSWGSRCRRSSTPSVTSARR